MNEELDPNEITHVHSAPLEELNPDEIYHVISPYLNEIQDKLYFHLSHGSYDGHFSKICDTLGLTEEQGEEIIEQIKEIQYKNFSQSK